MQNIPLVKLVHLLLQQQSERALYDIEPTFFFLTSKENEGTLRYHKLSYKHSIQHTFVKA
jgi:hypothetical protein